MARGGTGQRTCAVVSFVSTWEPPEPEESGSEFSVMGEIWWCLLERSSAAETLPVSMSEKKPLESISAANESAMEFDEIIDDGMLADMLYIPVS